MTKTLLYTESILFWTLTYQNVWNKTNKIMCCLSKETKMNILKKSLWVSTKLEVKTTFIWGGNYVLLIWIAIPKFEDTSLLKLRYDLLKIVECEIHINWMMRGCRFVSEFLHFTCDMVNTKFKPSRSLNKFKIWNKK